MGRRSAEIAGDCLRPKGKDLLELRHHQRRADGTWRDTVVFSILSDEWPGVRDRLRQRIGG